MAAVPGEKMAGQLRMKSPEMTENFLNRKARYRELCDETWRDGTRNAQSYLAGILHALGLALYYGKDPAIA